MDHLHTTEASSLLHPWSQIGWPSRYTLPLVTVPPRLPGFRLPSRLTCPEAYVGKKHPRKLTSHLKYFLICDQGPSSSEIPHCSSFRPRWMCLCDSCNPHPWGVCALKLDLWDTFLLTSRIPIRRGCPPFSKISGPPESPLHASVITPSVREAVYNHSFSTYTYQDVFNWTIGGEPKPGSRLIEDCAKESLAIGCTLSAPIPAVTWRKHIKPQKIPL